VLYVLARIPDFELIYLSGFNDTRNYHLHSVYKVHRKCIKDCLLPIMIDVHHYFTYW